MNYEETKLTEALAICAGDYCREVVEVEKIDQMIKDLIK